MSVFWLSQRHENCCAASTRRPRRGPFGQRVGRERPDQRRYCADAGETSAVRDHARLHRTGANSLPPEPQAPRDRPHRHTATEQGHRLRALISIQPQAATRRVPTVQEGEHHRSVDAVLLSEVIDVAVEVVADQVVDLGAVEKCLSRLDSPDYRTARPSEERRLPLVADPGRPTLPAVARVWTFWEMLLNVSRRDHGERPSEIELARLPGPTLG